MSLHSVPTKDLFNDRQLGSPPKESPVCSHCRHCKCCHHMCCHPRACCFARKPKTAKSNDEVSAKSLKNPSDCLYLCMDVSKFTVDELKVRLVGSSVIVEGEHKETNAATRHGYVSRRFIRRTTLPKNCDADSVTCTLSEDGVLCIRALKRITDRRVDIQTPDGGKP